MRLHTCFCGTKPHLLTTQVAHPKSLVTCYNCNVTTHQHDSVKEAAMEWNDGDGIIWRTYRNTLRLRFLRWWHGRNI